MQTMNFFSRVGAWFKSGRAGKNDDVDLADVDDDGLLQPTPGSDDKSTVGTLLSRGQERTQSLQRLEDGYQRLSELVESIQQHLQNQDRRTRQIAEALATLADPITQLPENMRKQHEQLHAIAEQLEAANARSAMIESSITELPKIADAQRETLVTVRDEIAATRKTQDRVADCMDGFRDVVGSLTRASDASVATLQDLRAAAAAADDRLADLLSEQNRKTNLIVIVAIVTAAVLTIATVASIFVNR